MWIVSSLHESDVINFYNKIQDGGEQILLIVGNLLKKLMKTFRPELKMLLNVCTIYYGLKKFSTLNFR